MMKIERGQRQLVLFEPPPEELPGRPGGDRRGVDLGEFCGAPTVRRASRSSLASKLTTCSHSRRRADWRTGISASITTLLGGSIHPLKRHTHFPRRSAGVAPVPAPEIPATEMHHRPCNQSKCHKAQPLHVGSLTACAWAWERRSARGRELGAQEGVPGTIGEQPPLGEDQACRGRHLVAGLRAPGARSPARSPARPSRARRRAAPAGPRRPGGRRADGGVELRVGPRRLAAAASIDPAAVSPNRVLIRPGSITTTSTPKPRTSKRSASEIASTACLVAW